MRIEQLENVLSIAKYRSINRAAIELRLAQQSLMSSLKSLEDELGFKIFHRSRKGVEPTEVGMIFLEEAQTVLSICHGWDRFRDDQKGPQTIRFALVSAFRQDISELCMTLFARYGDALKIQSESCYLHSTIKDISEQLCPNFIFYLETNFCPLTLSDSINGSLNDEELWMSCNLYQYPCEIFVSATHPWIQEGKTFVTTEDLAEQTLIFNSKYAISLFPNNPKNFLPNKEGVIQAVLAGKGIGFSLSNTITDKLYLNSQQMMALPFVYEGIEARVYFKLLHRRQNLMTAIEKDVLAIILQHYKK